MGSDVFHARVERIDGRRGLGRLDIPGVDQDHESIRGCERRIDLPEDPAVLRHGVAFLRAQIRHRTEMTARKVEQVHGELRGDASGRRIVRPKEDPQRERHPRRRLEGLSFPDQPILDLLEVVGIPHRLPVELESQIVGQGGRDGLEDAGHEHALPRFRVATDGDRHAARPLR